MLGDVAAGKRLRNMFVFIFPRFIVYVGRQRIRFGRVDPFKVLFGGLQRRERLQR